MSAYNARQQLARDADREAARDSMSTSERALDSLRNHKKEVALIGLALLIFGGGGGLALWNMRGHSSSTAENSTATSAENSENRRALSATLESQHKKQFPDIRFITSGEQDTVLWISSPKLGEKFFNDFQKPSNDALRLLRLAGFKSVVIKNGRNEWPFKLGG